MRLNPAASSFEGKNDATKNRPASKLAPHSVLSDFYAGPDARAEFVTELFDRSAPDYDWISKAMSLGTDRFYRRMALRRAGLRPGMKMLDAATGTGLLAQAALDVGMAPSDLVGVDPSRGMLEENRRRREIQLVQARGEELPFPDGHFDFVAMGYALRHVEDLLRLFAEFGRVLKPQGRLLILELTRPANPVAFFLMRLYMQKLVPWITRLATRKREPARLMEYYWATIAECVPPATILSALAECGFTQINRRTQGGVLSEYTAGKGLIQRGIN